MLQHNVVRKIIVPKLFMMLFIKYWPHALMWTKTDQLNNSVTETFYLGQLQNRNWKVYKINKMIVQYFLLWTKSWHWKLISFDVTLQFLLIQNQIMTLMNFITTSVVYLRASKPRQIIVKKSSVAFGGT